MERLNPSEKQRIIAMVCTGNSSSTLSIFLDICEMTG